MQGKKQDRVKIITFSKKDCGPCKEVEQEIRKISNEFNIDLISINIDETNEEDVTKTFGEIDVVPTIIIESDKRSKKLVGFKEGELRDTINEVLKPEELANVKPNVWSPYTKQEAENMKEELEKQGFDVRIESMGKSFGKESFAVIETGKSEEPEE